MNKYVNVKCDSMALGDTLACVPVVEYYRKVVGIEKINFDCAEWLWVYLRDAYPFIHFCHIENPEIHLNYHFDLPVQKGFAFDLFGIPSFLKHDFEWKFIPPTIVFEPSAKPFANDYFTFAIHSTAQVKYWNTGKRKDQQHSPRWRELCRLFKKVGIDGVMVDKFYGYGQAPYWNEPPNNCTTVINQHFDTVLNTIFHSAFFIGLSSGMSWVALALGKKTCMIAPWTYPDNEFGETTDTHIRIDSDAPCTNCWDTHSTEFDKSDWYWCPKHKNTPREFECSASIYSYQVFNKIKENNWI